MRFQILNMIILFDKQGLHNTVLCLPTHYYTIMGHLININSVFYIPFHIKRMSGLACFIMWVTNMNG